MPAVMRWLIVKHQKHTRDRSLVCFHSKHDSTDRYSQNELFSGKSQSIFNFDQLIMLSWCMIFIITSIYHLYIENSRELGFILFVMRNYKISDTNIYFTEIKSTDLIEFNRYNFDRRVPFNKKCWNLKVSYVINNIYTTISHENWATVFIIFSIENLREPRIRVFAY